MHFDDLQETHRGNKTLKEALLAKKASIIFSHCIDKNDEITKITPDGAMLDNPSIREKLTGIHNDNIPS